MDNRRRPIREYFDAARSEPGISEQEARELVLHGASARPRGGERDTSPLRRLFIGGVAVIALVTIILLLRPAGGEEGGRVARTGSSSAGAPVKRGAASAAPASAAPAAKESATPVIGALAHRGLAHDAIGSSGGAARRGRGNAISDLQQKTDITAQQETMMLSQRLRSVTAAAVAMMGAATMSAQMHGTDPTAASPNHEKHEQMMKVVRCEMGKLAVEYWTPKLNEYKGRIDRILAPNDLEELNRLRVRFNVIANAFLQSEKEERTRLLAREKEELTSIYNAVKDLATRYRSQGDALGVSVKEDIVGFFPVVAEHIDNLAAAHQKQIEEGGYTVMVQNLRGHLSEATAFVKQGPGKIALDVVYPIGIEPLLMLYDGTDLKTLLTQAERFFHGREGNAMFPSSAIAGYELPESSLLKQSTPNPASGMVRIGYTLNEPSSHTLLRLFNAKGDLVGSYDQGSRPAGEQEATIDLASLPAGAYLYHLTIQTSKGEQVYSKTLQVVR